MRYLYRCPTHGDFEDTIPGDAAACHVCGDVSRRVFAVSVNRSGAGNSARWDPVVGDYVANHREFEYKLRQGQERESEKLGMEVKLEMVDAADHSALAELHGHTAERREHDLSRS